VNTTLFAQVTLQEGECDHQDNETGVAVGIKVIKDIRVPGFEIFNVDGHVETVSDALAGKHVAGSAQYQAFNAAVFSALGEGQNGKGTIFTQRTRRAQRRNQRGWRIEDGKGGPRS
jgi:hypothetical protein